MTRRFKPYFDESNCFIVCTGLGLVFGLMVGLTQ